MNFINKVNKYLLEHYPLIWNTRLVWMIGVNILVHMLFFISGYFAANGLEDLKANNSLEDFFFESSNIYYNLLFSILVTLIWIIFYLRNNAFKNLYAVKKRMLFQQFSIIFLVFFISSTQYFTFKQGLIIKIKSLYNWEEVDEDIKTINKIALFLPQSQNDYEINYKYYPEPFPLNIAVSYNEKTRDNIDTSKIFIKRGDSFYQFYKLKDSSQIFRFNKNGFHSNFSNHKFEKRIVKDIGELEKFFQPSLLNYSQDIFTVGQGFKDYKDQIKYAQEILKNKDDLKIKEELKIFLNLANKYNADFNLNVENWFSTINNKPDYFLTRLINESDPRLDDLNSLKYNYSVVFDDEINEIDKSIPYSKTLYFSYNRMDNVFENIYYSYFTSFDLELFCFVLFLSLFLSSVLFIFKTTTLKIVLLSIVSSLVISVVVIWMMTSSVFTNFDSQNRENFVIAFVSFSIITGTVLAILLGWKKTITSILLSLSIYAVPVFVLFVALIYKKYLRDIHLSEFPNNYNYNSDFEIWFNNNGVVLLLFIWISTILIYSLQIRKLIARKV